MLDLFTDKDTNWLPYDGEVYYQPDALTRASADRYFQRLMELTPWKPDEAIIYGKHVVTARKTAWYADQRATYTYSGVARQALLWNDDLRDLKERVEKLTGESFNGCLLNLYHNGGEGIGWHADDESALRSGAMIASLSLGAARKFVFKHRRSGEKVSILLEPGSLLRMQGETQQHWLHTLPKTVRVREPRINLTFRQMNLFA